MLVGHPLESLFEFLRRYTQWAARLGRFLRRLVQLVRNQPGLEHAVTCHRDHAGDVDAHRAYQRTAPAHRAAVVQQVLPFFELFDGDLLLQA